ncbi:hypothetical protein ACQCVE_08480 [Metabacillus sp. 113a]|uniref:hypothetical protein n=1 Tax=Metabacillus sp. 113a TaxID=3404706 RepID=UPI003CEFBD27
MTTPHLQNSCEKPANTETAAETDKSLLEILGDVFLGIGEAIVQILTEIIVGLFDLLAALFTDPIGLAYGVITTVMNLDEVLSSMVDALVVARERDFINGDARSRARFVTYGVLSIFGTKGLSKVSKAGSLGKAGKKVSDVDDPDGAKKPKTDIPYNVMNAEQLFNEMKEAIVRNVTKMTDHAVDLVKSKVMKTAVQLKVLSGKMADIIQTAKNVLNPQKINKALKWTYDEMVKGPLVDTKMVIINGVQKAKEFFTLLANINERLAEAAVGVGSGTRTAMNRVRDVVEEIGDNVSEIVVGGGKGTGKVAGLKSRKLSSEQLELDWLADKYTAVEVKGTVKIGGKEVDVSRRVYQIEIDKNYVPNNPKALGKSNGELMKKGKSPYIVKDGVESKVELHHFKKNLVEWSKLRS